MRYEAGGSLAPAAMAAAVERACEKLSGELESLVGQGGAAALVRRAQTLARREFPLLDGGTGNVVPRPEQAEAANAAVLAHLMGLLVNLLGEDLGLRPVRKIWPDVASNKAAPSSTETEG